MDLGFLDFVDRVGSNGAGVGVSIVFLVIVAVVLAMWLRTGRP
jgi:hypothetical protein